LSVELSVERIKEVRHVKTLGCALRRNIDTDALLSETAGRSEFF